LLGNHAQTSWTDIFGKTSGDLSFKEKPSVYAGGLFSFQFLLHL
jgi:hypothetical protein